MGHDALLNLENLSGSAYNDVLIGDDGPNEIFGGSRADLIEGRGGDDTLVGGPGTDEADGGDGTDGCDAELESNCEIDPSAGPALNRSSRY
ncbi:MAG TPA: hypothetical protein VFA00_01945 [Actinomycetota bacterium]|nr:hypothetical protein [Actinomycetota bacterium]